MVTDLSQALALIAAPDQAITYRAGIWHIPMTALDRPGRFAVLTWRAGDGGDEQFVELPEAVEIRSGGG